MKRIIILLFYILFFNSCDFNGHLSPPLINLTENYFPISIGNTWIYTSIYDTIYKYEYKIFSNKYIDGKLYYEYGIVNFDAAPQLVRFDLLGRIILRINNKEYVYFDFGLNDGDTYSFKAYALWDSIYSIVTVERNISVICPAGEFDNCIGLFFDIPEWDDDGYGFVFAPNIGIVNIYSAWDNLVLRKYYLK